MPSVGWISVPRKKPPRSRPAGARSSSAPRPAGRRGGLPLQHIAWFRRHYPDDVRRARRFLFVNDFIGRRLTGRLCMNPSDAGITQLMDLATGDWDDRLLGIAGVGRDQLSPIRPSGAAVEPADPGGRRRDRPAPRDTGGERRARPVLRGRGHRHDPARTDAAVVRDRVGAAGRAAEPGAGAGQRHGDQPPRGRGPVGRDPQPRRRRLVAGMAGGQHLVRARGRRRGRRRGRGEAVRGAQCGRGADPARRRTACCSCRWPAGRRPVTAPPAAGL